MTGADEPLPETSDSTPDGTGTADLAAYVDGMRQLWGLGDYTGLAGRLASAAAVLVEEAAPADGTRVLDLAAGTGNVAVLAAARGARVVANDLAPRMVELGRERTAGLPVEWVPVEWVEADAESLPLPDTSFDAVLSAFGVIFVPRPDVALAQARRVLATGGLLALTAWEPGGFIGEMTELMRRWLPSRAGVADVLDWGREPVVTQWLTAAGFSDVAVRPATLPWNFDTPAEMTRFFRTHSPAHQAAATALGDRAGEMFDAVERLAGPDGGPVRLDASYVVVTARAG